MFTNIPSKVAKASDLPSPPKTLPDSNNIWIIDDNECSTSTSYLNGEKLIDLTNSQSSLAPSSPSNQIHTFLNTAMLIDLTANSQPSAPSSPPNQKHSRLNDDEIFISNNIEQLHIIKLNIKNLFSIILETEESYQIFNNAPIKSELMDIYNKFKYIIKVPYSSEFAKKEKEPIMIYPLCNKAEDVFYYGNNYDDPRLSVREYEFHNFNIEKFPTRKITSKDRKPNGCLFCRYRRLQCITENYDITVEELNFRCPIQETADLFNSCNSCRENLDTYYMYNVDEEKFTSKTLMLLSIFRRFFPYFIAVKKSEALSKILSQSKVANHMRVEERKRKARIVNEYNKQQNIKKLESVDVETINGNSLSIIHSLAYLLTHSRTYILRTYSFFYMVRQHHTQPT